MTFGDMFQFCDNFPSYVRRIDSQISRFIVKYHKTPQDIIQRKYRNNLLVFIESYSGDHRQIQSFRLGINGQIFLIS